MGATASLLLPATVALRAEYGVVILGSRDFRTGKVDGWRRDGAFNLEGALNHSLGLLILVQDNSDGAVVLRNNGGRRDRLAGAPIERVYTDVDAIVAPAVDPKAARTTGFTCATRR